MYTFTTGIPALPRVVRLSRARWICSATQQQSSQSATRKRARERRQDLARARVAAHLSLKAEIEARRETSTTENLLTMFLSLPPFVRERCGLTAKLARVKTVFDRRELNNDDVVRSKIVDVLTRIFPELKQTELIRNSNDFTIKTRGQPFEISQLSNNDTQVYLEIIPINLPPPRRERSDRWHKVRALSSNSTNTQLRMVSFYKFYNIEDPVGTAARLKKVWGIMGALGRVYVAKEGINAQMAVPEVTWKHFVDAMKGEWTERGEYLIPKPLIDVYLNEDGVTDRSEQPFDTLHVRPREKVLADGLSTSLDWNESGKVLPPAEWHEKLKNDNNSILVDCRNKYETDVGKFEDAETPNTKTFRETWAWLENRLRNVDKNTSIMTYCTGGIRCVKVNAYLEQKMGFTNTSRLGGGIVSYARALEKNDKLQESKYKGNIHVFDGRIGRIVTDELLTRCENCGTPSDVQTDCANIACDRPFDSRLFIQCPDCAAKLRGACSQECYNTITKNVNVDDKKLDNSKSLFEPQKSRDETYSDEFSMNEPEQMEKLRHETEQLFAGRSHMMSGPMQGAFLGMLVQLTNCRQILELGTFVGYSTLYMANALPSDGKIVTCEIDEEVASVARRYFAHDSRIELNVGSADEYLNTVTNDVFDMVFIDANKGGYEEYYETILNRGLIRPGGLMIFDNVLFKGLVATSGMEDELKFADVEKDMVRNRQRSIQKAHRIARKLHNFNLRVRADDRTEQVLLPARDGLLLVRVKG